MTRGFLSGRALSRTMYVEAVRPLMREHAAGLPYAAALIGPGSDVLGYDTERSMDHDWGPRLTLFLPDEALDGWTSRLDEMFLEALPETLAGYPTRFREFADDPGVVHMASGADNGPLMHRVQITSVAAFMEAALGLRSVDDLDVSAWLTIPEQVFLEITGGAVFYDETGDLTRLLSSLAWYPDDVWRYRLAAAWKRIAQVEPFIGRAGEVGDALGSHVIAMSIVRDVMRLTLLQERRYAPYAKWLGTALAAIGAAGKLVPHLDRARFARSWEEREAGTVSAVALLAERQNDLGLCERIDPTPRPFHNRPFTVIAGERFADSLTRAIVDPVVRALPAHLGGIDQFVDSTDALESRELCEALREWLRQR